MHNEAARLFKQGILIFIYTMYCLLVGVLGLAFINLTFGNPKNDTTPVSYVGFAVLAATANICFSWARTTNSNSNLFKNIRYCGELSFLSTVLFLLAAIMKYFAVNYNQYDKKPDPNNDLLPTLKIFSATLFIVAYLVACVCFAFIVRILAHRFAKTKLPFVNTSDSFNDTPPKD